MVIINEKRKKNQHKLMKDERKPFFFYVGFLSQTFTNYKTAGKGMAFLQLLTTIFIQFTDIQTLAR